MTCVRNGFTLIELLVVVLIIGILASVALPQYQKAVEKSRAAQAFTLLKAVAQASEAYFLANGQDALSFDELTVDVSWPRTARVIGGAQDTRSNGEWALEVERSSSSGATVLFMTRLTGKYSGAGLQVLLNHETAGHPNSIRITCFERTSASTRIFDSSLQPGSYCVQIMKGILVGTNAWQRGYRLR